MLIEEWPEFRRCRGEDSTCMRMSRKEHSFAGLGVLLMLWPSPLLDLHSRPSSSLLERAPELCEPCPESQEVSSDGMSSHIMTTRVSTSTDPDTLPVKLRLFFFFSFDFFLKLSILLSSRKSLSSERSYALVAGITSAFIYANKSFDELMFLCKSILCILSGLHHHVKYPLNPHAGLFRWKSLRVVKNHYCSLIKVLCMTVKFSSSCKSKWETFTPTST